MTMPHSEQTEGLDSSLLTAPSSTAKPFKLRQGIEMAVAFIFIQILVSIPITIIGVGVAMAMGLGQEVGMTWSTGASMVLSFPAAVWYFLRNNSLATTVWDWVTKDYTLIVVSILLIFSISYIVGGAMEYMPGYDAMYSMYETMFSGIPPIVLLIAGGIIGPVCEEIIFRGIILKGFLKSYSPKKAIVYSALIFGVIHLMPLQVISAFFAGLVLGYIYYKTKSLWLPIIIHVLNNLLAFGLGFDSEQSTTRSYFDNEMIYLASFVAALLVAGIAYKVFEHINGPARHEGAETALFT